MADPLWFKVTPDLLRHPKTMRLCERLSDARAWSYVIQMWAWFVEHEGSGRVSGPDAALLVARGAGWLGSPDDFCRHLVTCGFLDSDPEGLAVHDWAEWAGFHVVSRERARDKKRKHRLSRYCPPDVPGTGGGQVVVGDEKRESEVSIAGGHLSTLRSQVSSSVSLERGGLQTKAERRAEAHPRTAALLAAMAAAGCPIGHASELPTRASVEAALETAPGDVQARVLAAWGRDKKPTIGWYLDAITGAPAAKTRAPDPRAPAAPSTDWTDTRAPWEITT